MSYIQSTLSDLNNEGDREGNSKLLKMIENNKYFINRFNRFLSKIRGKIATKKSKRNQIAKKTKTRYKKNYLKECETVGNLVRTYKKQTKNQKI